MKTLFKDYKESYDLYVATEKNINLIKEGLEDFARFVNIDYSFACLIHFVITLAENKWYDHMWISPFGAVLWTKVFSKDYIAKWIAPNGEYADYYDGVRSGTGDLISDIKLHDILFENINEDELNALKILVEALDLDIDIY